MTFAFFISVVLFSRTWYYGTSAYQNLDNSAPSTLPRYPSPSGRGVVWIHPEHREQLFDILSRKLAIWFGLGPPPLRLVVAAA